MNTEEVKPGMRVRLRAHERIVAGAPPLGTTGTIVEERGAQGLVAVRWDGWEKGWRSPRGVGKRDCWLVYAHDLDREDAK